MLNFNCRWWRGGGRLDGGGGEAMDLEILNRIKFNRRISIHSNSSKEVGSIHVLQTLWWFWAIGC